MSTKLTGYVWDGCAASGMKLSSVAIMARLADFSNDEGVCWPSIETIARQIGAGMSTVRTAIARLEAEGWLTRKARRQGNYLWRPGLELGQPSSLAGYGIAENEQMPDIAADAKAIAFGNFKRGYTIVDRIGTRILRDPYTNKPFVGFYTTKRTGGMLVDSQAIKLLKIAVA